MIPDKMQKRSTHVFMEQLKKLSSVEIFAETLICLIFSTILNKLSFNQITTFSAEVSWFRSAGQNDYLFRSLSPNRCQWLPIEPCNCPSCLAIPSDSASYEVMVLPYRSLLPHRTNYFPTASRAFPLHHVSLITPCTSSLHPPHRIVYFLTSPLHCVLLPPHHIM